MTKVSIVDFIAKKLKRCIAIVEDGDTASQAIAAGKYVIWKGNPCKASTAISSGDTLSSSNLTALSDGVGNEISASIPAVVNNLTSDSTTSALSAAQGKALNSNIVNLQKTVVKTGTTDTVLDGSTSIKHAGVPAVSGYTLKGLTANFYNDGFYQYYSLFILNGNIYVRNPGNDFTSSTQFKMSYVAVYEKNT